MQDRMKTALDTAAIGGGWLSSAAYYADRITPVMTAIMVTLSVVWLVWRMIDRWRFGPKVKGE